MISGKFYHDLLDLDIYLPNPDAIKWPSLKLIFDNLRWYPLLGIFGVAMRLLGKSPDSLGIFAFWFLVPIFVLLFFATMAQTAILLSVVLSGIVISFLLQSEHVTTFIRKHRKWIVSLAALFFVALNTICFFAAAKLLVAFAKEQNQGQTTISGW